MKDSITLPMRVDMPDGRVWRIFDVEFTDSDAKKFSFYVYAVSREHASYIVEDIRRSAVLGEGGIIGSVDL